MSLSDLAKRLKSVVEDGSKLKRHLEQEPIPEPDPEFTAALGSLALGKSFGGVVAAAACMASGPAKALLEEIAATKSTAGFSIKSLAKVKKPDRAVVWASVATTLKSAAELEYESVMASFTAATGTPAAGGTAAPAVAAIQTLEVSDTRPRKKSIGDYLYITVTSLVRGPALHGPFTKHAGETPGADLVSFVTFIGDGVTPVGMKADEKEMQSALCKRSAALFRLGLDAHAVTWTGPEKAMGIDAAMLELRESPRAAEVLRDVADFLAQNKGLEAWAFWVRPASREVQVVVWWVLALALASVTAVGGSCPVPCAVVVQALVGHVVPATVRQLEQGSALGLVAKLPDADGKLLLPKTWAAFPVLMTGSGKKDAVKGEKTPEKSPAPSAPATQPKPVAKAGTSNIGGKRPRGATPAGRGKRVAGPKNPGGGDVPPRAWAWIDPAKPGGDARVRCGKCKQKFTWNPDTDGPIADHGCTSMGGTLSASDEEEE